MLGLCTNPLCGTGWLTGFGDGDSPCGVNPSVLSGRILFSMRPATATTAKSIFAGSESSSMERCPLTII